MERPFELNLEALVPAGPTARRPRSDCPDHGITRRRGGLEERAERSSMRRNTRSAHHGTERVSVTDASAAWRAGRARPRLGEEAVLIILHAASLGALMAWAVTWLGA